MNEKASWFLDLLATRSSVRSFQEGKAVPPEDEERIIRAAQRGSTSCNLQTYAFISVNDRRVREYIAEKSGEQHFIVDAGLFLVACADLKRMEMVTEEAGYRFHQEQFLESFLMSVIDTAIAAQTAALTAEALGYGICMIGALRNHAEAILEILQLPDKIFPLFGLCIGHPAQKNPPKPRLPLEGVLFTDTYRLEPVRKAIHEYDRTMGGTRIYCDRELPADTLERTGLGAKEAAEYGWIEHSARRVASKDPRHTREQLRQVIEKAGFGLK